ncbi:MAG: hypothetical protein J6D21_08905 [Clostridia bacterium]|nr:hypothetical protein [Clostridia bacterium]
MEKQPAEKSYVFDQGYRDVGNAFAVTWGQTFDRASIQRLFSNVLLLIPNLVVFLVITVFRVTLNTIISILLIAGFLIVAPIVYIGFVVVAFFDFVYRAIKRISSMCPNCQYRFDLPAYVCPTCGRKHTRLIPSQYGVFKRKCLCGTKLPTTFFNGRQKLKAMCGKCGFDLRDGGNHVDICIPVVGGPSAGKTCFINMAIDQIHQTLAAKKGYVFEYVSNGLNDYEDIVHGMKQGYLPEKTSDMRLKYYQFYLTPKEETVKRLVSICDVGGEVYADGTMIGNQIGFRYANAFIIVIDPLSIAEYRDEISQTVDLTKYGASTMTIDEILSRLVVTLENLYSISSKTMLKTDVAVVFTKCDLPGLSDKIGRKAVNSYIRDHYATREAACNILCEAFLRRHAEDNFVNNVKSKFKSVQYFTCSSLGDVDGKSFIPDGVAEPILWLMKKILNNTDQKE